MAIIMSSFAIDIGTLAQDARRVQLVADMVALDAVRALPANPTAAAQASAVRNGFPYTDGEHTLLVEWGPTTARPVHDAPGQPDLGHRGAGDGVVAAPPALPLRLPDQPQNVSRKAVSTIQPRAGFTIGSSLVTLDTASVGAVELPHRPVHRRVGDQPVAWPAGRAWPPGSVGHHGPADPAGHHGLQRRDGQRAAERQHDPRPALPGHRQRPHPRRRHGQRQRVQHPAPGSHVVGPDEPGRADPGGPGLRHRRPGQLAQPVPAGHRLGPADQRDQHPVDRRTSRRHRARACSAPASA